MIFMTWEGILQGRTEKAKGMFEKAISFHSKAQDRIAEQMTRVLSKVLAQM